MYVYRTATAVQSGRSPAVSRRALSIYESSYIQGAYEKFSQNILDRFEAYNEAKKTCNTAMERKFCQLSEFVQVKKLR